METNYIILLSCLVFLAFLVLKEVKRKDKSRLFWRLLATVLMMVSFALFVIPIRYSSKKTRPVNELNIITEGTSPDTIQMLKAMKMSDLASLSYHLKAHPEIKKLNIHGYGMSGADLTMLKGYQVSFHNPAIPSGMVSINWPKSLNFSEQFSIQGVYHNATSKAVKLKLSGLGVDLDSVNIKANTKVKFSFSTQPKQIGKALFNLIALHDRDTLSVEPVPFEVLPKSTFNVLILASSPDFEYKFLKRWLYENQHSVAFRSKISKDKYSSEFLNRKAVNLEQLSPTLLKTIDVAVVDEEEIRPEVMRAVGEGMGLIVRAKALKKESNHQPLLRDTAGQITVDRKLYGMGKIINTSVVSTYEWQLTGKPVDYGKFWSLLFTKALRKENDSTSYTVDSKWPTVGEKLRLLVQYNHNNPPQLRFDQNIAIAPKQNMELPFIWDGLFWPTKSGWTTIVIAKKVQELYIYKDTDWKSVKNFEKLRATENFIANHSNANVKINTVEYMATEQVNKLWFFLIFLIAIAFLWYEQRSDLRSRSTS